MKNSGSFIISLDYELMWGLIDLPSAKQYGKSNVSHVESVIQLMVTLFEKYDVKATFATVGMLMCKDKTELLKYVPSIKPQYTNKNLSPYDDYIDGLKDTDSNIHFAPKTIELLKGSSAVEIGTHTFCHYYCWEDGQTASQFEEDIKKAVEVAKAKGIEIKSIVFPRNNVNSDYLEICYRYGITSYRGNALRFFDKSSNRFKGLYDRICRLLDAYLPISGMNSYELNMDKKQAGTPINIPASRFLRPYDRRLSIIEPLKIKRITNEIKYAARHGQVYHLWWHPHNFGSDTSKNLDNLEAILKCYQYCHQQYGMQSYTMTGITEKYI